MPSHSLGVDPVNILSVAAQEGRVWDNSATTHFNNEDVTVMRLEGTYYYHVHDRSDEVFYILDGEVDVDLREPGTRSEGDESADRTVHLVKGDFFVVPKGTEHRGKCKPGTKANVMFILSAGALDFMADDAVEAKVRD